MLKSVQEVEWEVLLKFHEKRRECRSPALQLDDAFRVTKLTEKGQLLFARLLRWTVHEKSHCVVN